MKINKIKIIAKENKNLKKSPNSTKPIDETRFLEDNTVSKKNIRIENEDENSESNKK